MLDTSTWERQTLSVQDELHLDPKNVRLETASAQVEADIIEDLFDNENAFELVDAIAKIGYLTHEVPIAVNREGEWVVVEGNRRLAALKAIQNPMIVPNHQARVAALAKGMGDVREHLAEIEVLVAPSQDEADQLIAALHTSNPRKAWSPARQAAFFQAQIDSGRHYSELRARYPTVDVPTFVLRAHLVNRLKSAVSDDAELADFVGSPSWKKGYSALTRIFESRDFREITGTSLDKDGGLTTTLNEDSFDAVAQLIVEGMHDRSINTRSINTVKSPRFTALISEMRQVVEAEGSMGRSESGASSSRADQHSSPEALGEAASTEGPSGKISGAASSAASLSSETAPPRRSATAKKATVRRKAPFLPTELVADKNYPVALQLHLEELSRLNYRRMPNTTFLALRALLEKSIKAYAEAKGQDIKSKRSSNGFVQLHHCLSWLVDYFAASGMKSLAQAAGRVQSGKFPNYTSSNDALNAVNHNHRFSVDADEVLDLWNSIDPLMRELMRP